jgi:hypothetical protein
MQKLESSRLKPGRMEETSKGGRGPPWAVAPLERERKRVMLNVSLLFSAGYKSTKNKFSGFFLILYYEFIMFRALSPSSDSSCLISSISVERCRYLMTIL